MQPDKTWCYCKRAREEINTHKLDAIANIILRKNIYMKFDTAKKQTHEDQSPEILL
jgi:hypothetical protein